MVVTGFDDRFGCGYVLCTGQDTQNSAALGPRAESVSHGGITVTHGDGEGR